MPSRLSSVAVLHAATCLLLSAAQAPVNAPSPRIVYDSSFSGFSEACSAAGATATLAVTSVWLVPAALSCPASILFYAGGVIKPAGGTTVTLAQNTWCPPVQQCFDISLAGSRIAFTALPASITPNNFGASPSASAETNTLAFNAATGLLSALTNAPSGGGSVTVPCGVYQINGQISVAGATGGSFSGCGYGTVLRWSGNNNTCMILSNGNYDSFIGNFSISTYYNSTAHSLKCGIEVQQNIPPHRTSQHNRIQGVFMNMEDFSSSPSIGTPHITDGILIDKGANENNNDFTDIGYNRIVGVINSAINNASGGQSYSAWIHDNTVLGSAATTYGVVMTPLADYCGSFTAARNGTITKKGGWNYSIGAGGHCTVPSFPVDVSDENSETNGGFFQAYGFGQVNLHRGRWVNTMNSGPVQLLNFQGGTSLLVDGVHWQVDGPHDATIYFNFWNFGNTVPRLQFVESLINSTSFTFSQLMPSGFVQADDMGLTFSDGSTGVTNYFYPNTYAAGTLTVTNGSKEVTGEGTLWNTSAWLANGKFPAIQVCDSTCITYGIHAISSPTSIMLDAAYRGAGGSGRSYLIGFGEAHNQFQSLNVTGVSSFSALQGFRTGVAGNSDANGILTMTGGSVTYTFSGFLSGRTQGPVCTANDSTAPNAIQVSYPTTNSVTFTGTSGDQVSYQCSGRN